MKKKHLVNLSCIATVAIAAIGIGMKTYSSYPYESSSLLMQNVEALSAQVETTCKPGFVRDRYLQVTTKTEKLTCTVDGSISYKDSVFAGEYKKEKEYLVVITETNCDGIQAGSCCDQSKVGVTIKKV